MPSTTALEGAFSRAFGAIGAGLLTEVDRMITARLRAVVPTIATQQAGLTVSDKKRVLNFQGPGVTVTDSPANRRVDIYVPGSVVGGGSTSSIYSSTTAKAFSLWNGASNNTPPANWQTVAFNDAAWAAAVVATSNPTGGDSAPAGASRIWSNALALSQTDQCLFRTTFTLGSAAITGAAITADADDLVQEVWVNGTLISGTWGVYTPNSPITILPSLLVTGGGNNVIAVWGKNNSLGSINFAWVGYRLDLTTGAAVSSGAVNGTLGSLVACTVAGTYYDGPSVVLSAGTWFVTATVTTFNNTGGGTIATVKLWDGTFLYASTEMFEGTGSQDYTHTLSAIIALSSTTTIKASVAYNNANGRIAASTANGGTPAAASQINALKVG